MQKKSFYSFTKMKMKKSVILGLSVVLVLGAYVSAEDLSGSTTPPICQKTGCQNRIMINGMRQEIKLSLIHI